MKSLLQFPKARLKRGSRGAEMGTLIDDVVSVFCSQTPELKP